MALTQRAIQTASVISLFAVLGSAFVALRLWTRFMIIRSPGWEDWVLISSWVCSVATVITIGMQIGFGLGSPGATLTGEQLTNISIGIYVSISTYCASIGLTKIAILVQYQRVFPTRKFQIWCWSFIAIIVAYTMASVLACIFVCWPVQKYWKPEIEGKCINTFASWFANAAINIVTDFMIIILPMPVVRNLQLAKRQKMLLLGVFAFGIIVCIISIVRLNSLRVITQSRDPAYDNTPVATFSIVEINVALICACLPTLRPLLSQWISGLNNSSGRNTHGSHGLENSHGRQRSSIMGALGSYGVPLKSLSQGRDTQRLDADHDAEDRIRVVTRVDVKVHGKEENSMKDGRESSTDSLFRDTKDMV